jgi:hypothetical protein
MEGTQRKEIRLKKNVVVNLQILADADRRKLKPYMEKVLEDHSKKANKIKK